MEQTQKHPKDDPDPKMKGEAYYCDAAQYGEFNEFLQKMIKNQKKAWHDRENFTSIEAKNAKLDAKFEKDTTGKPNLKGNTEKAATPFKTEVATEEISCARPYYIIET